MNQQSLLLYNVPYYRKLTLVLIKKFEIKQLKLTQIKGKLLSNKGN